MGRNSKARRDARRRAAPRRGPTSPLGTPPAAVQPGRDPYLDPQLAEHLVQQAVSAGVGHRLTAEQWRRRAAALVVRARPLPVAMLGDALGALLVRLTELAAGDGWLPDDLREIVRRRAGAEALTRLESLVEPGRRAGSLHDPHEIGAALALAAALAGLPPIPHVAAVPASGPAVPDDLRRKLATVRALLAKAESTSFDEEAESLTAKAQELISRYALESLLAGDDAETSVTTASRIWLDAPYVDAKASLVSEVAGANRCLAVSTSFDLCLVVGSASDLAYVELLVTSLLVQAVRAMGRSGSQVDRHGVTRTRSFRQSFLLSFATRIGQRLREATEQAVADHAPDGRLLPAIRAQEVQVQEAFDELFPHLETKRTTISNNAGWAAGAVAADLAHLDVHRPVPRADAG